MWVTRLRCAVAPAIQSRVKKVSAAESLGWATTTFASLALRAEGTEHFAGTPRILSSGKPAGSPVQFTEDSLDQAPYRLRLSAYGVYISNSSSIRVLPLEDPGTLVRSSLLVSGHPRKATAIAQRLGGVFFEGEVTLPQTRSVHSSDPAGKKCAECQRLKDLVDFGKNRKGVLRDACRACAAASVAKRKGTALHHLGLSTEQAWADARTCSRCVKTKEVRDFAIMYRSTGKLMGFCRACHHVLYEEKCRSKSPDTLLECRRCHEVKLATEFKHGCFRTCKVCTSKRWVENYHVRRAARLSIPGKKRCTICGEEKRALEFCASRRSNDRLQMWCKKCGHTLNALVAQSRAQTKQQPPVKPRKEG